MKLTKIALGVSLGLGGVIAKAADVAMFPLIMDSDTMTTVVTVMDRGVADTMRYDANGNTSKTGNRLHWLLNYKALDGVGSVNNPDSCLSVGGYLPTKAYGTQTVDIAGRLSSEANRGLLFGTPSSEMHGDDTYALVAKTAVDSAIPVRGVLFVHDADNSDNGTNYGNIQGEALVFDFQNGITWGYNAETTDSGKVNDVADFDFSASASMPGSIVSILPKNIANTRLIVTPVNAKGGSMLAANGAGTVQSNSLGVSVGLTDLRDRDGNLISSTTNMPVTCVGGIDVSELVPALINGGSGKLNIVKGTTTNAVVYKLEKENLATKTSFKATKL